MHSEKWRVSPLLPRGQAYIILEQRAGLKGATLDAVTRETGSRGSFNIPPYKQASVVKEGAQVSYDCTYFLDYSPGRKKSIERELGSRLRLERKMEGWCWGKNSHFHQRVESREAPRGGKRHWEQNWVGGAKEPPQREGAWETGTTSCEVN